MLRGGPMSRSIKFNDDTYLDSKGVDYKHTNLETTLDNIIAKNNTQDTNITNVSNRVTTNTNNIVTNRTDINYLNSVAVKSNFVSGDVVKTTTIATATFTEPYQSAFLVVAIISCASGSAEDTGIIIFKGRSTDSKTNLSYGFEKTNTAQAAITTGSALLNFQIKQTVKWRFLHCVVLAKSDNVTLKI